MTDFEKNYLKNQEYELAEKVKKRVESELIKFYSKIGAFVIIILGIIGSFLIDRGANEATQRVENKVKEHQEMISIQKGELIALKKDSNQTNILIRNQLNETNTLSNEMTHKLNVLRSDIEKIDSAYEISLNLDRNYLKDIEITINKVVILENQLKLLEESLVYSKIINSDSLISKSSVVTNSEKSIDSLEKSTTVFFQFAGSTRDQAKQILEELKIKNYIVPGEDREDGATGKYEVRYFHNSDKTKAEDLAKDVTTIIRNLGYTKEDIPDIYSKDLTNWNTTKPKEGTLELWLYIPKR